MRGFGLGLLTGLGVGLATGFGRVSTFVAVTGAGPRSRP